MWSKLALGRVEKIVFSVKERVCRPLLRVKMARSSSFKFEKVIKEIINKTYRGIPNGN